MSSGSLAFAFIGLLVIIQVASSLCSAIEEESYRSPTQYYVRSDTDIIRKGHVKAVSEIYENKKPVLQCSRSQVKDNHIELKSNIKANTSNNTNRSSNATSQSDTVSVVISEEPLVNASEPTVNASEPTVNADPQVNTEEEPAAEAPDGIFSKDWKTICNFYEKHKLLVSSVTSASIVFLISLTGACVFLRRRRNRIRQDQRRLGSAIFAVSTTEKQNLRL